MVVKVKVTHWFQVRDIHLTLRYILVITIFLCTPLRIRYLQPNILCSCKGEGFFEGRVFPTATPVY